MQVLDSAGELGWQPQRAGLPGDGGGESGSFFSSSEAGFRGGARGPAGSAGTLRKMAVEGEREKKKMAPGGGFVPDSARRLGARIWQVSTFGAHESCRHPGVQLQSGVSADRLFPAPRFEF